GYTPETTRHVDFLTSYPPGDVALGELWGPMREETNSWLARLTLGHATPHATAAEAHNRLMLTKALDLSARRKCSISLPITPEDEERLACIEEVLRPGIRRCKVEIRLNVAGSIPIARSSIFT